jgi:hypothetical protein
VELLFYAGDGPQLHRLDTTHRPFWLELLVAAAAAYDPHQATKWANQVEDFPTRLRTSRLQPCRATSVSATSPELGYCGPSIQVIGGTGVGRCSLLDKAGDAVGAGRAYLMAATALDADGQGTKQAAS